MTLRRALEIIVAGTVIAVMFSAVLAYALLIANH